MKRRAYFLRLNQARIVAGKKPKFVNLTQAEGLTPIPVLMSDAGDTNTPPNLPEYAAVTKEGREFSFHRSADGKETHVLPIYPESAGTVTRLALSPFAFAGDTVMVAAVGVIALAESHASYTTR